MHFAKDILVIDFETTGTGDSAEPIEVGAVLLDKSTLEEKKFFTSEIKADISKVDPQFIKDWQIDIDKINAAPEIAVVGKSFFKEFGSDVLLSSWNQALDGAMLHKIIAAAGIEYPYDYHVLDIWPIAYLYLLKNSYAGGIDSDEIFAWFGIPKRSKHVALEDCWIEAEVLRKIISNS